MRIIPLMIFCLLSTLTLLSQAPVNDDCGNAIDLGNTPFCDSSMVFDNFDATPSNIGNSNIPICFKGDSSSNDVWFTFTTTNADQYNFTIEGIVNGAQADSAALSSPEVTFYTGVCDTNQLSRTTICESANLGDNLLEFSTGQLSQNTQYFMRVNSAGSQGENQGNFRLCITENMADSFLLDDVLSVLCEGQITDTGGANGDYSNNEDFIFTICPEVEHGCLTLDMGEYLMEFKPNGGGDYFIIYDGMDTTGPIIGASRDMRDTISKSVHSGIDNSVCQKYMSRSGCMTIKWHTDSSVVADGFVARWMCQSDTCMVFDTMSVIVAPTDEEIIGAVQGRLLTIDGINRMCPDTAHAVFDGEDTDFAIPGGLLLTTGRADSVARANMVPNFGWNNDTVGIPLLDSLAKSYGDTTTTHDGCAIELEFTPDTDVMMMEFSLGSEEYTECLVEQLTDILGVFYTTNGFQGNPQLNNYDNIARFTNNQTGESNDIQIDLISPFDSSFYIYYSNNLYSPSLEYDGILSNGGQESGDAQKFVLLQQNVEPCQPNYLLNAIADRGDSLYDSGIFISNIRCLTPSISFVSSLGLNFFIETCNPAADSLIFQFPREYEEDTEWQVQFEGAAQLGDDFIWTHGGTIILPAGQNRVAYDIDVVDDSIEEGSETFKVKLFRDWGCGEVELTELDVSIRDRLIAEIDGPDSACKGDEVVLNAVGDLNLLNMLFEPESLFSVPNSNRVTFTADDDVTIYLTGTLNHQFGSCSWGDSIDIAVVDPMVELNPLDPVGICIDEEVRIEVTQNEDVGRRRWSVTGGNLTGLNDDIVTFSPTERGNHIITLNGDSLGCTDQAVVTIIVDEIDYLDLIEDTTVCLGSPIDLVRSGGGPLTNYTWTPEDGLDDASSANPTATPDQNITYTVNYESENGFCTDQDQVSIEVVDIGRIAFDQIPPFCSKDTITIREIGIPDSIKARFNPVYEWEISNQSHTLIPPNGTDEIRIYFDNTGPTDVRLSVSALGCTLNDTITVEPSNPGRGGIQLTPDSVVDCALVTAELVLTGGNASIEPGSISWEFDLDPQGDNMGKTPIDGDDLTVSFETNASGAFRVKLTDENGCPHEYSQGIPVLSPENILIPNAFTPNGDQRNDVFRVIFEEGLEYEVSKITIFNRWGNRVFEGNDNSGWDGTIDGEPAMSEVYLFLIEMRDGCGNVINQDQLNSISGDPSRVKLQGDVTLIR